jgi:hypothetical protein
MSFFKRLTLPLLIVFGIGLLGFAQEFVPHPMAHDFTEAMTTCFKIMGGFAMILGIYSLTHLHVTRIRQQGPGWGYSMFVFLGAGVMIILGFWNDGTGPLKEVAEGKTYFDWGYDYVYVPCQATIFSILAFFMASAAFRTFRARNVAAAMLLIAAVIVMFGRVPVSESVGRWFGAPAVFTNATDFLMNGANMAAKRGIILGVNLGVLAQSLRILLGIERSYLGGQD